MKCGGEKRKLWMLLVERFELAIKIILVWKTIFFFINKNMHALYLLVNVIREVCLSLKMAFPRIFFV